MIISKLFIRIFLLLLLFSLHAEGIYKWTDANGNVHFGDKPQEGAVEVQLPNIQTFSAPPLPMENVSNESVNFEESSYEKLTIVHPEDQITIRNPQGAVSISVEVTPKLKSGDKIQLILDELPIGNPQINSVFMLEGINRGSHAVSAKIVNAAGKELIKSNTITIFMKQPWAGMGKHAP